jgi:hypothetical protein
MKLDSRYFNASLFYPCSKRVRDFDQMLRSGLADSLEYLLEVTEGHLTISDALAENKLQQIRDQPVLPEVIAAYHELVFSVQDEDFKNAQLLIDEIFANVGADTSFQVISYNEPSDDVVSKRYLTQIISDSTTPINVFPAQVADYEKAENLIHESFDILRESCPPLHDEIRALLKRVMLGAGPTEKDAFTFDGASAFGLWGAIVLNAIEPKDVVDMVQTLAHESCHNLLFGYCIEGQLVENPDDERHASPLRLDPRPLDGIFHATFVLARMHYSIEQIAQSPRLNEELQAKIKKERQLRAASFYDGLSTLKAHARYTPEGQALIDAAEAYMNSASAVELTVGR